MPKPIRVSIPPEGRKRLLNGETLTFEFGTDRVEVTLAPEEGLFNHLDRVFDKVDGLFDSVFGKSSSSRHSK
jgi:hypothetical protein